MLFLKNKSLKPLILLIVLIIAISGLSMAFAEEISVIAKPSVSSSGYEYKWFLTSFDNYCPLCKNKNTLTINPKKTYEVELTCKLCDADYCGVTGIEKMPNPKGSLNKTKESVLSSVQGITRDRKVLTMAGIKDASTRVKKFINNNKALPKWVVIDDLQYSMDEYTYISSKAILKISKGDKSNINIITPKKRTVSTGKHAKGSITKIDTINLAKRVSTYVEKNKKLPSYSTAKISKKNVKISNKNVIYLFADTIDKSRKTNKLPSKVTVNTKKPLIK
ncbi:MAG: pseudomurein-binding repeat-containing protein [Methanobacteriaceae archaeon]